MSKCLSFVVAVNLRRRVTTTRDSDGPGRWVLVVIHGCASASWTVMRSPSSRLSNLCVQVVCGGGVHIETTHTLHTKLIHQSHNIHPTPQHTPPNTTHHPPPTSPDTTHHPTVATYPRMNFFTSLEHSGRGSTRMSSGSYFMRS